MQDFSDLKLKPNGQPADRLHYILNTHRYIEYWMTIPVTVPKPSIMGRIRNMFRKK